MLPEDDRPDSRSQGSRRRFLKAVGALGVTGLAGCGGDGGGTASPTATATSTGDTGTPTGTTVTSTERAETPIGTTGDGVTDTTSASTGTPTSTAGGCRIPGEPDPLLSYDGETSGTLNLAPSTETITGTLTNPYLSNVLENGSVTLESPGDGWSLSPESGTTFNELAPQESQPVAWDVSLPQVRKAFDLIATVTYDCGDRTFEAEKAVTARVGPTEPVPDLVDFEVADDVPGRSVVRQSGHFTPLQLIGDGLAQMVYFTREAQGYQTAVFDWEGNYDDGSWHHCLASYDASEGLRGYIDGETVVEQSTPAGELKPADLPFALAASVSNPVQELYQGALDEVAVYSTALSADQAATLAGGGTVAEDSLVARWSLDEVAFGRTNDAVNDNTLFLANSPEQVSGTSGGALQFDGDDAYAVTPPSGSLDVTQQKSVSFFFKTTQSV